MSVDVSDELDTDEPAGPAPRRRLPWATLLTIALAAVVVWGIVAGIGAAVGGRARRLVRVELVGHVDAHGAVPAGSSTNALAITERSERRRAMRSARLSMPPAAQVKPPTQISDNQG